MDRGVLPGRLCVPDKEDQLALAERMDKNEEADGKRDANIVTLNEKDVTHDKKFENHDQMFETQENINQELTFVQAFIFHLKIMPRDIIII